MKPQIPWLRVGVEGLVIVGSILLAFGIQAWWEESLERGQEKELLVTLEEEFRRNKEIVAWRKQFKGGIHDAGLSMVEAAVAGPTSIEADSMSQLLANATWFSGAYSVLETGAARTAIEGGNLGLIQSATLRSEGLTHQQVGLPLVRPGDAPVRRLHGRRLGGQCAEDAGRFSYQGGGI